MSSSSLVVRAHFLTTRAEPVQVWLLLHHGGGVTTLSSSFQLLLPGRLSRDLHTRPTGCAAIASSLLLAAAAARRAAVVRAAAFATTTVRAVGLLAAE